MIFDFKCYRSKVDCTRFKCQFSRDIFVILGTRFVPKFLFFCDFSFAFDSLAVFIARSLVIHLCFADGSIVIASS